MTSLIIGHGPIFCRSYIEIDCHSSRIRHEISISYDFALPFVAKTREEALYGTIYWTLRRHFHA